MASPFDDLSKKEQEELLTMRQASSTAETVYQRVQEFFHAGRAPVKEHSSTPGWAR